MIPNEKDLEQIKQVVGDLESLGTRGAASENERAAAKYVADKFRELDIATRLEGFKGQGSYAMRVLIHLVLGLLALGLLPWWPLISIALSLLTVGSFGLEMSSIRVGLSDVFSGRSSQNVVATVPAEKQVRRRIVVVSHLDVPQAGWFRSAWQRAASSRVVGRIPGPLKAPLFPFIVVLIVQVALGLWVGLSEDPATKNLVLVLAIAYMTGIVLLGQWAVGPFPKGANDNASGVAGAMMLVRRWTRFHHDGTELVVLISGCEASGSCGAAAWAAQNRQELNQVPTVFLNLDTIGFQHLQVPENETVPYGLVFRYPEALRELTIAVANEMGLKLTPQRPFPRQTDGLALLVRGVPGVTITTSPDGTSIYKPGLAQDSVDNLDFVAVYRAADYAWRVVLELEDFGLTNDIQVGDAIPVDPQGASIAMETGLGRESGSHSWRAAEIVSADKTQPLQRINGARLLPPPSDRCQANAGGSPFVSAASINLPRNRPALIRPSSVRAADGLMAPGKVRPPAN